MSRGAPARRPPRERLRAARRPGPAERPRPAPRLCDSAAAAPAPGPARPPRAPCAAREPGSGRAAPARGRLTWAARARAGLPEGPPCTRPPAARAAACAPGAGLGSGWGRSAPPTPARESQVPDRAPGPRGARRARPRSRPRLRGAGGVAVQGRAPGGGGAQGRPAPESRLPCRAPAPRGARRPASEQPLTLGVGEEGAPHDFQAAHPDLQAPRSAPGVPATGPGYLLGDPEPPLLNQQGSGVHLLRSPARQPNSTAPLALHIVGDTDLPPSRPPCGQGLT